MDSSEAIYKGLKEFLDRGFQPQKFNPEQFNKEILQKLTQVIDND